jgi:hypothetical protein
VVRKRVVLVVLVLGFAGVNMPGAGAASQGVRGQTSGTTTISFGVTTAQRDVGMYTSPGQLGSGSYTFVSTVSACDVARDTQTLSGTATLVRSDGAKLSGNLTGTEVCFRQTDMPARLTIDLTSGTDDLVRAHLVFNGMLSNLTLTPGGERGSEFFAITGSLVTSAHVGWWMLGTSGNVYAFGGAPYLGNAPTIHSVATRIERTFSSNGYWIVNEQGQVYALGDARWFGNADRRTWAGAKPEVVVSIASTASGDGYWLFTNKGRVVPFGDAVHLGDVYPGGLAGPIVAAVATPSHNGYYLLGSDGGVFAYGDATFRGSTGDRRLNAPVVGIAVSPAGDGYWLVASDGGVFAFGAPFAGSMGGRPLTRPIVGAAAYGAGYVLVDNAGAAFDFSAQPFFGSLLPNALTTPIAGVAATG